MSSEVSRNVSKRDMYVVREELSVRDGRKYIPIYSRAIELEHALAERVERTSEHLRAILAI